VVLARTVEAVDPEERFFELEVEEQAPRPSRLSALALVTWRLMRKYAHDAYESCRSGSVRRAASRARGGAERAARWGSAGAARRGGRVGAGGGVGRSSPGALHRLWR